MSSEKETVLNEYSFLVSETDAKGVIIFANDDFCKIAEYTIEELMGTRVFRRSCSERKQRI